MGSDQVKEDAITSKAVKPEQRSFVTVKETARYLRLCEKQVRRLISRGELPAYRFGMALRINMEDIYAYAEARRIHAV